MSPAAYHFEVGESPTSLKIPGKYIPIDVYDSLRRNMHNTYLGSQLRSLCPVGVVDGPDHSIHLGVHVARLHLPSDSGNLEQGIQA
jgi:hypothetical protein